MVKTLVEFVVHHGLDSCVGYIYFVVFILYSRGTRCQLVSLTELGYAIRQDEFFCVKSLNDC